MVLEAIKKRNSIRSYLKKEIPEDLLLEVMEAARLAPSAHNRQDWKFVIVQDRKLKHELVQACGYQEFVGQASVVIAGCATDIYHVMSNGIPSHHIDLSIALEHISLQAAELGLGSCWIGAFSQEKVKKILFIPENIQVVCLMTLGYPAEIGLKTSRKAIKEIICYNYFRP